MSESYINWENIKTAISELSNYEPKDVEISNFYDIKDNLEIISNEHEGFFNNGILDNFDIDGGGPVSDLYEVNNMYIQLISNIKNVSDMSGIDSGGGVDISNSYDSGGSGLPTDSGSSSLPTDYGSSGLSTDYGAYDSLYGKGYDGLAAKDYISEYGLDSGTSKSSDFRKVGDDLSLGSGASSKIAQTGSIVGAGSAIAGGALATKEAVSGIGDSSYEYIGINYPLGNSKISSDFINNLSSDEKETLVNKLKEIGYSDEEIEKIMNGEVELPKVLVDTLYDTLGEVYSVNPNIRNEIIQKYGIDIFDENGVVNKDKLAMVLIMDDKSGNLVLLVCYQIIME